MKKILVLEDEANIRSFVVLNLNRAGYETIEAGTGVGKSVAYLLPADGPAGHHAAGYGRL